MVSPGGSTPRGWSAPAARSCCCSSGSRRAAPTASAARSALVPLAASVIVSIGFVRHTLNSEAPIVDLRILAHPVFARAMIVLVILSVAQFARLVYIPLELGTTRHITAFTIGLVMLPQAFGIAIMMPIGGRLADKIGARVPAVVGIAIFAASFFALSNLSPETSLPYVAGVPVRRWARHRPLDDAAEHHGDELRADSQGVAGDGAEPGQPPARRGGGNRRARCGAHDPPPGGQPARAGDGRRGRRRLRHDLHDRGRDARDRQRFSPSASRARRARSPCRRSASDERGFLRELGELDLETESGLAAEVL